MSFFKIPKYKSRFKFGLSLKNNPTGLNLMTTSGLVMLAGFLIVGAGVYLTFRPIANKYIPGISGIKVPYIDPALGLPAYQDDGGYDYE